MCEPASAISRTKCKLPNPMYQLSDLLSDVFPSAPGDATPFIRTLAKRQDRKNNRARAVIIMAAGAPPPEHSALFVRDHSLHAAPDGTLWDWNITDPACRVDIYRSHSKCPVLPMAGNNCAWVSMDEMDTPEAPAIVLEAAREWMHKLWLEAKHYYRSTAHLQAVKEADEHFAATGEEIRVRPPQKYEVVSGLADEKWPDDQTIDDYIRHWRGDLVMETLLILLVWVLVFLFTRRLVSHLLYLEGFLRVCSWSRKIGYQGKWMPLEEYFEKGFHIGATHGVCPVCLEKEKEDTTRFFRQESFHQAEPSGSGLNLQPQPQPAG